ncbi:S8 family serine peptidase [Peterkaempfera bronchialis]|uniref:S8 family serine peptidase n=1 Tax=Peterkaempfera bronchialis TaxID=2126346 RepID=UPI002681A992|nr:S8 family serine peptidase [Peterkaempfera bronchialis]
MVFRHRSRLIGLVLGPAVAGATVFAGAIPAQAAAPVDREQVITGSDQSGPGADSAAFTDGLYIVQLDDAPVASYEGEISGLAATRPEPGEKVDPDSAATKSYRAHLDKQRREALAGVPGVQPLYTYDYAFNGFAANLTAKQAAKLAAEDGVAALEKNQLLTLDTVSTADFLGLAGQGGAWERQFRGDAHAGEGVVIGMVDSGYSPDNPLFAPLPEPRPDAKLIKRKWKGSCDSGTSSKITCNNKVIGAHYYRQGVKAIPEEYDSPRDYGGHGTHTASTAAGDHGVPASINGGSVGEATGMAPAARLAVYKVCWSIDYAGGNSCASVDTVAAINQAVADGVDVINYSISGSTTSAVNSVESAFFNAARAGVFVSASAGNDGDKGASTVAHNAPWEMTVAASTHDRGYRTTLTLGDGRTFTGVGVGAAVPSAPLVNSSAVGKAGADPSEVELCFSGTLDPVKTAGRIVVCKRGTNDRVDKSRAVQQAGGAGLVLWNPSANSLNADFHYVPTVHVDHLAGPQIAAYAASSGATASLSASEVYKAPAPQMAGFSSYGPALAGNGDLLKPDITAPGVDVIAGVAPVSSEGNQFGVMSGTSMSSPHIAGIAALLISKNPKWSPAEVKSALMTTAYQSDNQGAPIKDAAGSNATPLNFGAGHVDPPKAFDPGLVYDSGWKDWQKYICAIGQQLPADTKAKSCDKVKKTDPSDLNYPSIAIGALAGSQTVYREVTNVAADKSTYDVRVSAPAGFTAKVSPSTLTLKPGASKEFKVTLTRTTAPLGSYAFGSLTLTDGRHVVRSPIAVKAVAIAAPAAVNVAQAKASGKVTLEAQAGYAGTMNAKVRGLKAADVTTYALKNANGGGFTSSRPAASDQVAAQTVTVPAGTKALRLATFASDYPADTDVDLYLYKQSATGALTLTATSANDGSDEAIQVSDPSAGDWVLFAHLYSAPSTGGAAKVAVNSWVLGDGSAIGTTLSPATAKVKIGGTASFTLAWSGLATGKRYLGTVSYDDGSALLGSTTVQVATG